MTISQTKGLDSLSVLQPKRSSLLSPFNIIMIPDFHIYEDFIISPQLVDDKFVYKYLSLKNEGNWADRTVKLTATRFFYSFNIYIDYHNNIVWCLLLVCQSMRYLRRNFDPIFLPLLLLLKNNTPHGKSHNKTKSLTFIQQ